jgi:hypothetical protein
MLHLGFFGLFRRKTFIDPYYVNITDKSPIHKLLKESHANFQQQIKTTTQLAPSGKENKMVVATIK